MLDDIADRVEIQRLVDMQVLVPFSEASSSDVGPKQLSTRFVRTGGRRLSMTNLFGFEEVDWLPVNMPGLVRELIYSPLLLMLWVVVCFRLCF